MMWLSKKKYNALIKHFEIMHAWNVALTEQLIEKGHINREPMLKQFHENLKEIKEKGELVK